MYYVHVVMHAVLVNYEVYTTKCMCALHPFPSSPSFAHYTLL